MERSECISCTKNVKHLQGCRSAGHRIGAGAKTDGIPLPNQNAGSKRCSNENVMKPALGTGSSGTAIRKNRRGTCGLEQAQVCWNVSEIKVEFGLTSLQAQIDVDAWDFIG